MPVHFYLAKYYLQTGQYDLWLKESAEDDRLAGVPDRAQSLQQSYAQGGFRAAMESDGQALEDSQCGERQALPDGFLRVRLRRMPRSAEMD